MAVDTNVPRPEGPAELASAYDGTVGALKSLLWQARDVHDDLVVPRWGTEKHGYDRILYGLVMNIMAIVDRLSKYAHPAKAQTKRMRRTLEEMGAGELEAKVAVQLWRHTLMHTGSPSVVTVDGRKYLWLLQWSEQYLPRDQHLKLQAQGDPRALNFSAITAVEDLLAIACSHFAEWVASEDHVAEIVRIETEMHQRQAC